MRKQFTFYASFFEAIQELPDGQREQVYDAVCAFALRNEKLEVETLPQRIAMKLIMPTLISSRAKSLAAQRKNRSCPSKSKNKVEDKNEHELKDEIETEYDSGESEGSAQGEFVRLQKDFDIFWDAYPVKLDRQGAWLAWLEQKPQADAVMQALERWKLSTIWQDDSGRFIPQAKKFLTQGYAAQLPPKPAAKSGALPMGATGEMGEAEREAIRRAMQDI